MTSHARLREPRRRRRLIDKTCKRYRRRRRTIDKTRKRCRNSISGGVAGGSNAVEKVSGGVSMAAAIANEPDHC